MARQPREIDQLRYAEWVGSAKGVRAIEPGLIPFIEGLGRIDARLRYKDARFFDRPKEKPLSAEEYLDLIERITLSRLWVFGAYEVARTLSQRVRDTPSLANQRKRDRIQRTKQYLERLRIPLAKLEPAKRHAVTDFADAEVTFDRSGGVAWKVARRTILPRQRAADKLLKLCSTLKR